MLLNFEHLKTFYSALQQKIKSFRGNWEQNDPNADDYIKNRTHYSEGIQEVTVLQYEVDTDVSSAAPMDSAGPTVYRVDFDSTGLQPFVVGQQYSVKWDNASYTCIAKMYEGLPVLGDTGLLDGYEDTGEPFLIGFDAQEGFGTFMTTQAGRYTVTVTTYQEIVHKLDKKFIDIPDNLVTSDELEAAAQDASNKSAVVLAESQKYTDDKVTEVRTILSDETETLIDEKLEEALAPYKSAVSYEAQTLTEEQKAQARANIGITIYNGEYEAVT